MFEDQDGVESEISSHPPDAEGDAVGAASLAEHPVWRASRERTQRQPHPSARGRGRGKPPSESGDPSDRPRYERISLAALEQEAFDGADGADSRIESDEEEDAIRAPPRSYPDQDRPPDADEEEEDLQTSKRDRLAGLMGAAAFGGSANRYRENSDSASVASESSSRRRAQAGQNAFPVRGVTCVGCVLANRMGPVDRFVQQNISKMTEDALWKMAALTYKQQVAEPAEREGAFAPPFGWKEVRIHFELHSTGNFISRHKMVRQLQCMRAQLETRLVRIDGGERELDRGTADLMLKVCVCV